MATILRYDGMRSAGGFLKGAAMKTILVGIDLSEHARRVLESAQELADKYDAQLMAVTAVGLPLEFPIEALTTSPDGLPARLLEITQKRLDDFVASSRRTRLTKTEARIGSAWQVLCDTARDMKADAVVIGTHGYGALDRLIGTTAARVVNHAPCSVLVVRSGGI
jgi:universal stress protein F